MNMFLVVVLIIVPIVCTMVILEALASDKEAREASESSLKLILLRGKMILRKMQIKERVETTLVQAVASLGLWDCADPENKWPNKVLAARGVYNMLRHECGVYRIWAFQIERKNKNTEEIWKEYESRGVKPLDPVLLAMFIANPEMKEFFLSQEDSKVVTVWKDEDGETQSLKLFSDRFSAGPVITPFTSPLSPETWYFGVDND